MPSVDDERGMVKMEEVPAHVHPEPINLDVLTRQHEYSMNNDDEMRYLWTIRPDISREGIHVLVEFEPVQSQSFSDVQYTHVSVHEEHSNVRQHVTAITQIVSDEPNATYDYTTSGAFLDMGSGEQIDDLIESRTTKLLDWNDAVIDLN
ncbi:hypothetical protein M9H77_21402 [Catharanthus roseus]|uniref:Uncharacterized protein n=1 Tax=Catharanthus roseus TaxID=4058 RepID=A0ACC0AMM0_CATRO|nr:hypothetical protein M9H77_21402 [Catharanthus roseus]